MLVDTTYVNWGILQGHVTKGAIQLLPRDVRDLRDVLVGTQVLDLQMYGMIILGIKLFLRIVMNY
jgi:hypothetical protein